ncbi:VPLPA-CTERM sorting domain-containing protein [uncultured Roseobacter sp.]|uniref:VPLPA-CTERM sorting domain-containing protein n=1 Tax=uncultured Roseobacter sp. TaxID=114847 RepID=UPI00261B948B|nr:VPLPA-CTERM sorting domain-containing protein [uncultured Roseobacter sp.]
MKINQFFTVAAVLLASATSGLAATYNIVGGFTGKELGDVAFDITITADFTKDLGPTRDGLTVNSLTSSVLAGDPFNLSGVWSGPLHYQYDAQYDLLDIFGGSFRGVSSEATDVFFTIVRLSQTNAWMTDPWNSVGSLSGTVDREGSPTSLSVTLIPNQSPSIVPLPAGGLLFLTGLAGFASLRLRRKRLAHC